MAIDNNRKIQKLIAETQRRFIRNGIFLKKSETVTKALELMNRIDFNQIMKKTKIKSL